MVPHWCIVVVAALLLVTHTTAATAFSSPLTGSSFFWMTLTGTAGVRQQLQTDLESDMQAAAGAAGTVTVTDLNVNATALFVEYTIVSAGSVEAVQATVLASPLPTVEAYVETSKSSLSAIADLIPETVVFDPHVLYPRPGSEPAPAPVIVSAMTSGHRILVSGDAAVWQRVIDDQASALTTAIQASVESAVYRPLMTTTSTVQRYSVQQVGSKDAMGGPEGGLVVELTVSQELWEGGQGMYSIDELNGVLLTMELSAVSALYTAAGGTVPPQPRVVVASEITDPGFVCTAVCKGFIATLSITGGITVILIVLMVVFTCCCGWPTTRGDESNIGKAQCKQVPYA